MSNLIDTFYNVKEPAKQSETDVKKSKTLILLPSISDLEFGIAFFTKLFKALDMHIESEAHFIGFDSIKPTNLIRIHEIYAPNVIILAGLRLSDLDVQSDLKKHTPIHWRNTYVLITDSPQALEKRPKQDKADFWKAFKSAYV